jgi:hypothetical protein
MTLQGNKPCAEIVESSLGFWIAQSWKGYPAPPFGSLVATTSEDITVLAIVYQIRTGSSDPQRYPFTYQKTPQELRQEQPQIFEFLQTTFSCLTIGYVVHERILYQLAPLPPQIHAFVEPASLSLARQCFSCEKYLHALFSSSAYLGNLDELLLAIITYQALLKIMDSKKIGLLMQTYSLLTGNDYRRTKLFLQRVEPLVSNCL